VTGSRDIQNGQILSGQRSCLCIVYYKLKTGVRFLLEVMCTCKFTPSLKLVMTRAHTKITTPPLPNPYCLRNRESKTKKELCPE